MTRIHLDQDGYPCPPLLEPLNLPTFELRHVQAHLASATRQSIFIGYQEYLRDFRAALGVGFKQWVNGSFTTEKLDPDDIDIVNFVPHDAIIDFERFAPFQTNGNSRDKYYVDAYLIPVYPTDSIKYITVTLLTANTWASHFGFNEETGEEKSVAQLLFP